MTWVYNHLEMLFSGVAGTALVTLVGWWLTSRRKAEPRIPAVTQTSTLTDSPVAVGTNISQRSNSPNITVTLPSSAGPVGHERADEWRELIHELHEALIQVGYAFLPINVITPGVEDNDYEAGIRRGDLAIRHRLYIGDVLAREKILEKYQDLVKYAISARSPRERNQRGCPTMNGFDMKSRAFEDELIEIARKDINQSPIAPMEPAPMKARPLPNLVYAGGKRKSVFVSPFAEHGIHDPRTEHNRDKAIDVFVLKFENKKSEGGPTIAPASRVIAKLKFQHKNGVTARDIDYGVWLNAPWNSTTFGIGDTRELVLLCKLDEELSTFEDRRTSANYLGFKGFNYIDSPNLDGYDRVAVTLIEQESQTTFRINLKFWMEGANFCTSEE